jgi:hypothetical protein
MPWNDGTESHIAGSGEAYYAPVGTTLPTTADAALNAAFVGLGYHSEDGVTTTTEITITDHMAWQSKYPIRRTRDTEAFTVAFSLLQWNEVTVPFAYGGGALVTVSAGEYRYDPPAASDALQEWSLVVDCDDGTRRVRFVVPRGTVTEGVESQFQTTAMAMLPVSFRGLQPAAGGATWYPLFNDLAAFAAGS